MKFFFFFLRFDCQAEFVFIVFLSVWQNLSSVVRVPGLRKFVKLSPCICKSTVRVTLRSFSKSKNKSRNTDVGERSTSAFVSCYLGPVVLACGGVYEDTAAILAGVAPCYGAVTEWADGR